MSRPPLVPPLKCQGIKTKLVFRDSENRCDAGILAMDRAVLRLRCRSPQCAAKEALLCDTNLHIIGLYQDIQSGKITAATAKDFLTSEGEKLKSQGEPYYYEVRTRFNAEPTPLDFLFLNRSCFNGVIRFNRKGQFNVPYCHKPERFAQAYVTK